VTPLIRRILWMAAGVAVTAVAAVLLVFFLSQNTIGFGEKCGGGYCWGYQLDQYRFSKRTRLTISGTWGLRLEYELPKMQVERGNDDRWLGGDRAIYLNLRLKPFGDPAAEGAFVKLVYDFQRGELYVTSPLQLWRGPDAQSGNPGRNWMTEGEFQGVVKGLEP
jgi:hypothetical protein